MHSAEIASAKILPLSFSLGLYRSLSLFLACSPPRKSARERDDTSAVESSLVRVLSLPFSLSLCLRARKSEGERVCVFFFGGVYSGDSFSRARALPMRLARLSLSLSLVSYSFCLPATFIYFSLPRLYATVRVCIPRYEGCSKRWILCTCTLYDRKFDENIGFRSLRM